MPEKKIPQLKNLVYNIECKGIIVKSVKNKINANKTNANKTNANKIIYKRGALNVKMLNINLDY